MGRFIIIAVLGLAYVWIYNTVVIEKLERQRAAYEKAIHTFEQETKSQRVVYIQNLGKIVRFQRKREELKELERLWQKQNVKRRSRSLKEEIARLKGEPIDIKDIELNFHRNYW